MKGQKESLASTNPPTIYSVTYQNPYSPTTVDSAAGVVIVIESALVACRLLEGSTQIVHAGPTQTAQLTLSVPYALEKTKQYSVEVQVVDSVRSVPDWNPSTTATAPLLPSVLNLSGGSVAIKAGNMTTTLDWSNDFPTKSYPLINNSKPTLSSMQNHSVTLSSSYKKDDAPYTAILRPLLKLTTSQDAWSSSTRYTAGSGINYVLPTSSPTIKSVIYDGNIVTAVWTKPPPVNDQEPASYELLLSKTSHGVTTSTTFAATATGGIAPLTMPANSVDTITISARMNYGVIKGPLSLAVTVVTDVIECLSQTTDPSSKKATLSWSEAAGGTTSFALSFTGSGAPAKTTVSNGKSYQIPNALTANSDISASITKVITTSDPTVTSTGPSSKFFVLGTSQPFIQSATYDGKSIVVNWTAINDAHVYTLTLFVNGEAKPSIIFPANSGDSNFSFEPAEKSITITPTDTLTLTLQVTLNKNAGPGLPQTSPVGVSFIAANISLSTQSSKTPYLYPVTAQSLISHPPTASAIVLYLPDIYSDSGKIPHGGISDTNSTFTLNTNGGDNTANYPYTLTISTAAWAFTTHSIRSSLQSDYKNFLETVESRTKTAGAEIKPWGISVLQEAIARHMPQTFEETLYYSYGLDPSNQSADLRPGMVLRVMPSDFIVVPDSDRSTGVPYLNGYVNSAPLDYDIGSYTSSSSGWALGFDAFISKLVSAGFLTVSPNWKPSKNQYAPGASEAVDLYRDGFPSPFYRLFIPSPLLSPKTQVASEPSLQFNLTCASSFTDLENTSNPTTANSNLYFWGRSVLKLCIRVIINSNEQVVPIGTTVKNILERYSQVPPSPSSSSNLTLEGVSLQRSLGQSDSVGNPSFDVGRCYRVQFGTSKQVVYSTKQNSLDLPLLHGDVLTIRS